MTYYSFPQVPEPPPYTPPAPKEEGEEQEEESKEDIVGHWEERLTMFQKLLLVKVFHEEKVRIFMKKLYVQQKKLVRAWLYTYTFPFYLNILDIQKTTLFY